MFKIQGIYFLANIIVSFIFLWGLPVGSYAIYFFCTSFTAITAVLCDLGLSQSLVNRSASMSNNRYGVISSYKSASLISGFYVFLPILGFIILYGVFGNSFSYIRENFYLVLLSIFIGAAQSQLQMLRSIFIGLRDNKMQAISYLSEAGVRMILSPLILYFSNASIALLINLLAIILTALTVLKISRFPKIENTPLIIESWALIKESFPLAPMQAYYIIQNQIPPFLIAYFGITTDLASYGALGRILIGFSFVSVVLATYLQPIFAKQDMLAVSIKRLWQISLSWTLISCTLILIGAYLPQMPLFVLGAQYSGLVDEVFFTILVGCVTVFGVIFYCMALSVANRNAQYLAIFPCMFLQLVTILSVDEFSVVNATLISLAPSIGYMVFQIAIGMHALFFLKKVK
ncbi:oligosaccharide flippase family protein [Roseobacter sp. HKCC-CH-9351]|uniref:oligosaccharide flippase family protein n=1 Tax=Roseobacter sp. HKCC-CH-9351 TaxID=3120341 RepID=UPI0030EB4BF0